MRIVGGMLVAALFAVAGSAATAAEESGAGGASASSAGALPKNYSCTLCHSKEGLLYDPENPVVTAADLAGDIHWQKGLRCHDCHGGNPVDEDFVDHRDDPSFHHVATRADIPGFCGRCHSDLDYMRQYQPSARTDQESEYWTSGHGQKLKASAEAKDQEVDQGVATCIDCHGRHTTLAVHDLQSRVYPTRVAQTCAVCHADAKLMENRTYKGQKLATNQYPSWRNSVHGKAMMDNGDLSAATCNDCHGNHGAVPPGVGSVGNACGICHGKVATLFAQTQMKHAFEQPQIDLPGCAACHSTGTPPNLNVHDIQEPTDEMLGVGDQAVCSRCHSEDHKSLYGKKGADVAIEIRHRIDELKHDIDEAEATISEAEQLGMEVRGPRFDLRKASDALTNARSLVHTFSPAPVEAALAEGFEVSSEVQARAEEALQEHTNRRIWLAVSLVPILIVVILLVLYVRTLPAPTGPPSDGSSSHAAGGP